MGDWEDVPSWVPRPEEGWTPVDVYPVREVSCAGNGSNGGSSGSSGGGAGGGAHSSTRSGAESASVELVLNRTTLTTGFAERRSSWEFGSCIAEGAYGAGGSAGGALMSSPAAEVSLAMIQNFRTCAAGLRREKPSRRQRIALADDDPKPDGSIAQLFPLQTPCPGIAFHSFLTRLASGTIQTSAPWPLPSSVRPSERATSEHICSRFSQFGSLPQKRSRSSNSLQAEPTKHVIDNVPLGPAITRPVGRSLEMLLDKCVSTQKAVWFIRIAILNECPKQMRPDRPAPSPKQLWSKLISEFFRSVLESMRQMTIPPEAVEARLALWKYALNLIRWQADEGLLEEAVVVNRVLLGEFRKELRSVVEGYGGAGGTDQPAISLSYRHTLLSMVLSAVERFEPELLAHRESTLTLLESLVSALSSESPAVDLYRERLAEMVLRLERRVLQLEFLPNAHGKLAKAALRSGAAVGLERALHRGKALVRALSSRGPSSAGGPGAVIVGEEAQGSCGGDGVGETAPPADEPKPPLVKLSDALACFPWRGDVGAVCQAMRTGFRASSSSVRFVVRWALLGPFRRAPLTSITCATAVRAMEMERSKGEKVATGPLFQRAILHPVEDLLKRRQKRATSSTGEESSPQHDRTEAEEMDVEMEIIAEVLTSLHAVGAFSFMQYCRDIRSLLSKGDAKGMLHLNVLEALPETADRSAALLRRGLLKRWRGQKQECTLVDTELLKKLKTDSTAEAREAGRSIRRMTDISSRLTHCELAARNSSRANVASLVACLIEAGSPRSGAGFVMKRMRDSAKNRDPKLAEILTAIPRVALAISASGALAELVSLIVLTSSSEPIAAESCAAALASAFGSTSPLWTTLIDEASARGAPPSITSALRGRPLRPPMSGDAALQSYLSAPKDFDSLHDRVSDPNMIVQSIAVPALRASAGMPLLSDDCINIYAPALSASSALDLLRSLESCLRGRMPETARFCARQPALCAAILADGEALQRAFGEPCASDVVRRLLYPSRPSNGGGGHEDGGQTAAEILERVDHFDASYGKWVIEKVLKDADEAKIVEFADAVMTRLEDTPTQRDVLRYIVLQRTLLQEVIPSFPGVLVDSILKTLATTYRVLTCTEPENAHDANITAAVRRDQGCAELLNKMCPWFTGAELRTRAQTAMIEQIKSTTELLKDATSEEKMLRPHLGEAVLRRLRALRKLGMVREDFDAAQTLLELMELVVPALDEWDVDEVLEAMRLAVDVKGREGREALKKRVVSSTMHYWLSPRQRVAFCRLFMVGRGVNGPFRRGLVAFAPTKDTSTRRRPIDAWMLLEGQEGKNSVLDKNAFGVQVGGDFKPSVRLKRTFSTFAFLAR